jgi:hypothetical protein
MNLGYLAGPKEKLGSIEEDGKKKRHAKWFQTHHSTFLIEV